MVIREDVLNILKVRKHNLVVTRRIACQGKSPLEGFFS